MSSGWYGGLSSAFGRRSGFLAKTSFDAALADFERFAPPALPCRSFAELGFLVPSNCRRAVWSCGAQPPDKRRDPEWMTPILPRSPLKSNSAALRHAPMVVA